MSNRKKTKAHEIGEAFGYMSVAEIDFLIDLASSICKSHKGGKPPVIVNAGAGSGTSGLAISQVCGGISRIFTIDVSPGGPLGGLENERNAFSGTDLKLPTQMLIDSIRCAETWQYGEIDMVFVDNNHSYKHVIQEIPAWWPHIKVGGIMALHDYSPIPWVGVMNAVDEVLRPIAEEIDLVDKLIAFRKK